MGRDRSEQRRPGWAAPAGAPTSPLGTLDILGLPNRRLSVACGLLLLLLVAASRFAAFPASIWDQDEAYLGLAVAHFDPAANRPHPPWFPLWVAAGNLAEPFASEPARGLQILGAAAAVWTLYPLVALLSIWMRRELAAAAAALYLFLPGPWFLAGRAFGDTTATFLLLVAAAWWLRPDPGRATVARGAIAAGLCLLVRPQLVLAVLGMTAFRWWGARGRGGRTTLALPLLAVVAAGGVATVLAAGGVAPLRQSLAGHGRYQLAGLAAADHVLAASGVARCLIRPELAMLWVLLAVLGVVAWIRHRRSAGSPWPLLVGGLAPVVVTAHWLSDPERARYALPGLALSSGLVVVGLASLLGRRAPLAVIAAAAAGSLAIGLPQAARFRAVESPAVAALRAAGRSAAAVVRRLPGVDRRAAVAADHGLQRRDRRRCPTTSGSHGRRGTRGTSRVHRGELLVRDSPLRHPLGAAPGVGPFPRRHGGDRREGRPHDHPMVKGVAESILNLFAPRGRDSTGGGRRVGHAHQTCRTACSAMAAFVTRGRLRSRHQPSSCRSTSRNARCAPSGQSARLAGSPPRFRATRGRPSPAIVMCSIGVLPSRGQVPHGC
jgi:hypothetical protein